MNDARTRVERYVERYFARSGYTKFPRVREVARGLNFRVGQVRDAVEEDPTGNLQLTSLIVVGHMALGDYYVETINPPKDTTDE